MIYCVVSGVILPVRLEMVIVVVESDAESEELGASNGKMLVL